MNRAKKPAPQRKNETIPNSRWLIVRFFRNLGPGLITGAADDDPSGVATYSIAGAQSGTSLLWMAWLTWPFMAAVQMMCARIGMATGLGLARNLCKKFPRPVVIFFCLALFAANIINIAADLSGMADAMDLLTGINRYIYIAFFGLGLSVAIVRFRYMRIANILKWITITLLSYVITPFILHTDWSEVARATVTFSIPHTKESWSTIVALLGTTISPYLFFWQSAEEVEEEKAGHRRLEAVHHGTQRKFILIRMMDVGFGTFVSNLVMFFIILTTALTLNKSGITNIETSKQAAEALRPLAGNLAVFFYTSGLVTVGLLAIPTLAGSSAYAFAETFHWRQGLDYKLKNAPYFYGVMIVSTACGVLLNFLHISPVKALLWAAIVNGLAAPFILVGVLAVAHDKKIMNQQPSSRLNQLAVLLITIAMFLAGGALFAI